jgi:hypothetical protein
MNATAVATPMTTDGSWRAGLRIAAVAIAVVVIALAFALGRVTAATHHSPAIRGLSVDTSSFDCRLPAYRGQPC